MILPREEYQPKSYISHPQCFDCAHCRFTDFQRVNDILHRMSVLESYVDINNLSLADCVKLGKIVCEHDLSCEYFEAIDFGI